MYASLAAGAAMAFVNDNVSWNERIAVDSALVAGYWTGQSSSTGSSTGLTFGYYASLDLNYLLNPNWTTFAGLGLQDSGSFHHSIGSGDVVLNLRKVLRLELGIGYSF